MVTLFDSVGGNTPMRSNSNHRTGGVSVTRMSAKECREDVDDAVEQDFTLHYRVTDTDQFLDKLLPVKKAAVNAIFKKMKKDKLYNKDSWKGFPAKISKEKLLYGPFQTIAEAIRAAAESLRPSTPTSQMGRATWVDYHSKSPKTQDIQGAQLRPDILFALETIRQHAKSQEEVIWWLQIIAAVEMKRVDSPQWEDLVKQLIGYLRRILREQLDRRFVFGMTLGPETMTVWMHDRSGVLGTTRSINIHKEPEKFIQVIAAFSLLSPEQLGFDPTIKVLVSPTVAVPSYKPTEDFIQSYELARHNRRWVIKMNDKREYVTVRTVSSVRAGFMRGRGSIVWVVVPFNEDKESKSQFFVLKQSWCPREVMSEGQLYEYGNGSECDFVGKIESFEDVIISGKPDTTDALIRQGLDDSTGLGKRSAIHAPDSSDTCIHVSCTDLGDILEVKARDTGSPVSRVRRRVLLSTYGWLIKYFSTLPELLTVLRDAIRGHQHLYSHGVLHRDVSPGNIIIEWHPGSDVDKPSTSGRLIDLDHAKKGKDSVKITSSMDKSLIEGFRNALRVVEDTVVDENVARLSLEVYSLNSDVVNKGSVIPYITAAIQHASTFRGFPLGQTWTPQHLRWKEVKISYDFDFAPAELQKGSRTGTPPYTSGEILNSAPYFAIYRDDSNPYVSHDAVHDLESFLWVLVHICMTRGGPGGVRREELKEKSQENEEYNTLRRVVYCFFDSDDGTMAANKQRIFQHLRFLDNFVLDNFHPYFQPLREAVKEWFHVLKLAYGFRAFEYYDIHEMVLDILNRTLQSLPSDIDEAGRKVLKERKEGIEGLHGNPFGTVQSSPPLHTSPVGSRLASARYSSPSSPTPSRPRKKSKRTLQPKK